MPLLIFAAMLADGIMAAAKKAASGQQLKVKRRKRRSPDIDADQVRSAGRSGVAAYDIAPYRRSLILVLASYDPARKREPMAYSSTTNEWATGLLPHVRMCSTSAFAVLLGSSNYDILFVSG